MRRPLITLTAMLLVGVAVFMTGHFLTAHWCEKKAASHSDDLDWFRLEFHLNEVELGRVRQLHEGYIPKCRDFCERIAARKRELQAALAPATNSPAIIEQKLIEIGTLRAQCQSAMLQHFHEVSQVMPKDQGRRYLAEMQRLTLGFHEEMEHAMAPRNSNSHGNH